MIDKKSFSLVKKELEKGESEREKNISLSRELTKKSKHAIYEIHRQKLESAEIILRQIAQRLPKNIEGVFNSALEEYAEAKLFLHFEKNKKIIPYSLLKVGAENYLGGLADLTGELGRRAVILGTKNMPKEVEHIRDTIDEIFGAFSQLDLRNGELRRKFDSIKWNLAKVEQIIYDLKTRK